MYLIKSLLLGAAFVLSTLASASSTVVALDTAPIDTRDQESLQRGAKLFANYCLSCHGASLMRFEQLKDIGLTEKQIQDNLMFAGQKLTEPMTVAMSAKDAKVWFGATPPDLSLIARSRGADWLYTYMRSFYRDDTRPTGWNNTVFDKVGMPHVLAELQGVQELQQVEHKAAATDHQPEGDKTAAQHGPVADHGAAHAAPKLKLVSAGTMTKLEDGRANTVEYDRAVADLTNFLVFLGEPSYNARHTLGYIALLFLIFVLLPLTYALKREYWKDVK